MCLPIGDDDAAVPEPTISLAPLGGVLDNLEHGVVLLSSDADACFTNAAAKRMLGADAERGLINREMRSVFRAAFLQDGGRPAEVEVETRAGHYRMRARILPHRIREIRARAVLVTIVRAAVDVPSRARLMERFRMTSREADVTLMLARGQRNAAIAAELKISTHTARHHTESVMLKLDVHRRSEISQAIVHGFGVAGARRA